jgi:type II secretory pathway predicted ATPase ExeA
VSQQVPKVTFGSEWAARSTPGPFELQGHVVPASPSPSLTYEPHYGLKEKPFSLSADPRFLYRSPAHAPAFEELLTGIRRREGLIVLTGEIGTGKTTLIRSVLQHLDRRTFTAFVPDPFVSREDLLKMLLVDFGVVSLADLKRGSLAGASRPDLSYPLYEFLDSLVPLQAFAVMIIDEAQNLPLGLLEEIRILSDLEQREKLLQVVLVGQPELKEHLKMPQMRQVDQRVSVRCELTALGLTDVGNYVRHRLHVASDGGSHVQFSDSAIGTIFKASGGVPRLINLICDRALQRGYKSHAMLIEPSLIYEAITSLGLEAPVLEAEVTRVELPSEVKKPVTTDPPAIEIITSTAMPVTHFSSSPQILSEFATEAELAGPLSGSRSTRVVLAVLALALAIAGGMAAGFLFYQAQSVDVDAAALPARPGWTSIQATLPPGQAIASEVAASAAPLATVRANDGSYSIQVASFASRNRADRLVTELEKAGFRARAVEFNLGPPRGLVLQIRIDGYENAQAATRDLSRIRELPGYGDAHLLQR